MAPFESLYGRRCRFSIGWFKVGENGLFSSNLVHQAMEKENVLSERLKTTQSHKKSYTEERQRELDFKLGDLVFLKASPIKVVISFGMEGKLSTRYIGPYSVLTRGANVVYEIDLPYSLGSIHPFLYVSMLKICVGDPSFGSFFGECGYCRFFVL